MSKTTPLSPTAHVVTAETTPPHQTAQGPRQAYPVVPLGPLLLGSMPTRDGTIKEVPIKVALSQLSMQFEQAMPTDGTIKFRNQLVGIVREHLVVQAAAEKGLDAKKAVALLSQIDGKVRGMHTREDLTEGDQELRQAAAEWVKTQIRELKPAQEVKPLFSQADRELTQQIADQYKQGDIRQFLGWLKGSLQADSKILWNAYNSVTALFYLNAKHWEWVADQRNGASVPRDYQCHFLVSSVAPSLIDRLHEAAQQPGVTIHPTTLGGLAGSIGTVATYLAGRAEKDAELEKKFFVAAAKLVNSCSGGAQFDAIERYYIPPVGRLHSYSYSAQGAAALCEYVGAIYQSIPTGLMAADKLSGIQQSFRSLQHISSWTYSEKAQASLEGILTGLNARLARNKEPLNRQGFCDIVAGLQGIDVEKLGSKNQLLVAQTLSLVSAKLKSMKEVLPIQDYCTALHSVSPFLSVRSGPISLAMAELTNVLANMVPVPPTTLGDLGFVCGSLVKLSPDQHRYSALVANLWDSVVRATEFKHLILDRTVTRDIDAAQIIKQAYVLYQKPFPEGLASKIYSFDQASEKLQESRVSNSERRIRDAVASIREVTLENQSFQDGFDLDIPFVVASTQAHYSLQVDGPHHQEPVQRRIDAISTGHFQSIGRNVVRVPSNATGEQVKQLVRDLAMGESQKAQ